MKDLEPFIQIAWLQLVPKEVSMCPWKPVTVVPPSQMPKLLLVWSRTLMSLHRQKVVRTSWSLTHTRLQRWWQISRERPQHSLLLASSATLCLEWITSGSYEQPDMVFTHRGCLEEGPSENVLNVETQDLQLAQELLVLLLVSKVRYHVDIFLTQSILINN